MYNTCMDKELEALQIEWRELYKDYYNYRPLATSEEWMSIDFLTEQIAKIHSAIKRRAATAEGREQLRESGWIIDEPKQ